MRITLHPGVWLGTSSFWLTGGVTLSTADADQLFAVRVGYAAIVLGALLLIWGIKWDGRHWWERLVGSGGRELSPVENAQRYQQISGQAFQVMGDALGRDTPLVYENALATIEPLFLTLKASNIPIPRLWRDGHKLGILRAHRYMNLLHGPLCIGDNNEARRRAMKAVPLINGVSEVRLWGDVERLGSDPAYAPQVSNAASEGVRQRRRKLVAECRLVARAYDDSQEVFRTYIEPKSCYIALKRHFSPEFVKEVERSGRTAYAWGRGAGLSPMAERLLAELDRLSEVWNLE